MADAMAVQVTIYLNEADQWHHRPLHMEILNYLRKENVYAATATHAVAGFLGGIAWRRHIWLKPAASCP
jgi:PII-like signaling protein